MKKITTTTLLLALVAAPLTIWAQAPGAGNNSQANPAVRANPNARIQLTEEQKQAILNGDSATVVEVIEAAGFSTNNTQFVTQLVTAIFNQVTSD